MKLCPECRREFPREKFQHKHGAWLRLCPDCANNHKKYAMASKRAWTHGYPAPIYKPLDFKKTLAGGVSINPYDAYPFDDASKNHVFMLARLNDKHIGREIAEKLGVSDSTISNWLTWRAPIKERHFQKIREWHNREFAKQLQQGR